MICIAYVAVKVLTNNYLWMSISVIKFTLYLCLYMDTNLSIDCILKKETLMIKVHVYIKGMQSVYFQGNATHYFIL